MGKTLNMLRWLPMLLAAALPLHAAETRHNDNAATSLPSYQASLEEFRAQRKASGNSSLSPEDRALMARSSRELDEAMPDPGLHVGAQAPDFLLPNARGEYKRLSDMLEDGPVVLVFYRGAWCPYCNLQLRGLKKSLPAFERHGAQLIAVTPQQPDKSLAQVEESGYPFEILSDLNNDVMTAYDLMFEVPAEISELYKNRLSLDLAEYNGEGRYVLPVPATFVIDRTGTIQAAFVDTDYRQRVEPKDVLDVLAMLWIQGLLTLWRSTWNRIENAAPF